MTYLAVHSHFCTILGQLVSDDLRGSLWNSDSDGNLQLTRTVGCSKSSVATRRTVEVIAASCCRLHVVVQGEREGRESAGGHTVRKEDRKGADREDVTRSQRTATWKYK